MDERQRLKTLHAYKILDTPREQSFDDLTRLAATLCKTPIALVSLVDEKRQWFKSTCGLQVQETERSVAFCDYAIRERKVLVIEDATLDSRFAANPLVLGAPGIRFYAGAPLIAPDGAALGTLCVISNRPQKLAPEQIDGLERLARQVVVTLESRLREIRLEEQKNFLDAILESMAEGVVACDAEGSVTHLNRAGRAYCGEGRVAPTPLARAFRGEYVRDAEITIVDRDRQPRQVLVTGRAILDRGGQKLGAVVTMKDISELKAAEAFSRAIERRYRALVDHAHDAVISTDTSGRVVAWNLAAERIFGRLASETLGRPITVFLPESARASYVEYLARVKMGLITSGKTMESRGLRRDGREFPVELSLSHWEEDGRVFFSCILRDISARKTAEAALADAHAHLEAKVEERTAELTLTIESIPHLVWQADAAGEITFVNGAWGQDVIWRQVIHPEDQLFALRAFRRALRSGEPLSLECRLRPSGQEYRTCLVRAVAQKTSAGQVLKWYGTATDIEDLRESEKRFRQVLGSPITGVVFWDEDGLITDANERFLKLIERTKEDLAAKTMNLKSLVPLEYAEPLRASFGSSDPLELELYRADGSRVPVMMSSAAVAGRRDQGISFITDLSRHKATQNRFKAFFDQSPLPKQLFDLNGRITHVNRAWHALWQITATDLLNKGLEVYSLFDDPLLSAPEVSRQIARAFGGESVTLPTIEYHPAAVGWPGRKRWIEICLSPVFDALGEIREVIAVTKDLTDIKEAERVQTTLRVREEAAIEASRLKSEFLANMSHEIRTPLNGVIGLTGLLLDSGLTREQRDYAENVKNCAETLLSLINDVLDFSKIEANRLELERSEFELGDLIENVFRTMRFSALQKKLSFYVDSRLPGRTIVRGDMGRLRQILTNLLGNALKFTEEGKVFLRVMPSGPGRYRFEVHDTGVGIPRVALARLFQTFSQADASVGRRFGGTGLGLSISKRLVELMNGRIGVESEEGRGSTFWFEIDLESGAGRINRNCLPARPPERGRRARILIAEDNLVNQRIVIAQVQKLGHHVDAVANGVEALDLLRALPYDLILMDCQMPEMDGYEATRRIRSACTLPNRDIPIIACTASAVQGERDKCLRLGMNDYLAKPFLFEELSETVERWLTPESAG